MFFQHHQMVNGLPWGEEVTQVASTVLEKIAKQEEDISSAKGFPLSLIF